MLLPLAYARQQEIEVFANIWKKRQHTALAERGTASPPDYNVLFDIDQSDEVGSRVMKTVLSRLSEYLYEKNLVLLPDDKLQWLIGIDDDEITHLFEKTVVSLGCSLPDRTVMIPKMKTVRDVLSEVQAFQSRCF